MQSLKSNLENEYKKKIKINILNKLRNILKDPPKIDTPVLINVWEQFMCQTDHPAFFLCQTSFII